MKYCLLNTNNEVIQVQPYYQDGFIECDDNVWCGMIREGSIFVMQNTIPTIVIPQVVTMRQARLALLQSNLLSIVDTTIATGADEAMKIEWEYATEVRRDWTSLSILATTLGMTTTQLDDLFLLASTL